MNSAEHQNCSCGENGELMEQAERSRQIISAIFDSTQSFMLLVSLDYHIIFFNKRALLSSKALYGRDLQVGDSFMSYQRKGDEETFQAFRDNFAKAVMTGSIITSEREMKYDRMISWFRSEYTPVYDHGKIIGVALRVVDVTDRKRREQKIENQNEQLRQISWIQSHQTRQPIATILGLVHILDKKTLTDDNKKIIGMLEDTVGKLDAVIRDTVIRANSV